MVTDELRNYVKSLLDKQIDSAQIKRILLSTGWAENDINIALSDSLSFPPPPAPPYNPLASITQPTHSIAWIGIFTNFFSLIVLSICITSIITLYFGVIDKYFPDKLNNNIYQYALSYLTNNSAIHYAIASLIIAFPLYFLLLQYWLKIFDSPNIMESKISKWLTYLVLLIAAGTIVGDFIVVIYNFLEGGLTARLFLKVLTVFILAGLVFGFYFFERKRVQYQKEVNRIIFLSFLFSASTLVVIGIIFGFLVSGSPGEARLMKGDQEKIQNLIQIAQGVNSFSQSKYRLPTNLAELKNDVSYKRYLGNVPEEKLGDYEYNIVSETTYELCSTFNISTLDDKKYNNEPNYYNYGDDKWTKHAKGRDCKKYTVTIYKNIYNQNSTPPIP